MLYKEIPVTLEGEIKYFNFDTIGDEARQGCKIWSGNLEMRLDKDLVYMDGDMPVDWINPAIDKLKQILGVLVKKGCMAYGKAGILSR